MLVCMIPLNVFADTISGSCGTNARWYFEESTNTLRISGTGETNNYKRFYNENIELSDDGYFTNAPLWKYYNVTQRIVIEEGITSIGEWSFYNFKNATHIDFPNSLEIIRLRAFHCCYSLNKLL